MRKYNLICIVLPAVSIIIGNICVKAVTHDPSIVSINNMECCFFDDTMESSSSIDSTQYFVKSDEEAIDVLKNSYFFQVLDKNSVDNVYSLILDIVNKRMDTSAEQNDCLRQMAESGLKHIDIVENYFLRSSNPDLLSVKEVMCSIPMDNVFNGKDFEAFKSLFEIESCITAAAYNHLQSQIPNIDEEGRYYTDRDELNIVKEWVRTGRKP